MSPFKKFPHNYRYRYQVNTATIQYSSLDCGHFKFNLRIVKLPGGSQVHEKVVVVGPARLPAQLLVAVGPPNRRNIPLVGRHLGLHTVQSISVYKPVRIPFFPGFGPVTEINLRSVSKGPRHKKIFLKKTKKFGSDTVLLPVQGVPVPILFLG